MPFIPDLAVLAAFAAAALLLTLTPGPDMTLYLGRTLAYGRGAGLASLTGASAGSVLHTLLAVAGISALLVASPTAFWILKLVGAAYLGWLAVDAIRNGSTLQVKPSGATGETKRAPSLWRSFWVGVGINLLNPKIVLFYMTFLPQFVSVTDPNATSKMLFLGLAFPIIAWPINAAIIIGAQRFVQTLTERPTIARAIDWLFATVFGVFAVKILLEEGR